jgi:hypothetical protein
MNFLENPNPANLFLSMYDTCIMTDNEEFCKDQIANASPTLVNAYLSVYSGCRRIAGPEVCKSMMAPKTSPSPIIFLSIGVLLGWAIKSWGK